MKSRDDYRCRRCGSRGLIEAHHIVPLAAGGPDTIENGVTLCHRCHVLQHGGRN